MEDVLLYIHILCAAVWLGGAAIGVTFLLSTKSLSPTQALPILRNLANLGKFVFGPTSVLVFISGIGLISVAGWSFSDTWISLAFMGIIASIIIGAVFHARAGRKALSAAESDDAPATIAAVQSWLVVAYVDLAIIAAVLALMVFKPGA